MSSTSKKLKHQISKILPRSRSRSRSHSLASTSSTASDDDRQKKKKKSLREKVQLKSVKPRISSPRICKKKSDINAKNSKGLTRLHVATLEGNVEVVRDLLSRKDIDINAEDRRHRTPLIVACENNSTDIALKLIKNNADLTVWDENFDTPLHIAFRKGNRTIADRIIDRGRAKGQLTELVTEPNWNWVAPIHEAVRGGHRDLVKKCLDEVLASEQRENNEQTKQHEHTGEAYQDDGSDIGILDLRGENDDALLHIASSMGHTEIVEMLVDHGSKLESKNWDLRTPLHLACIGNHREVVEYLADKKANLNANDVDDLTPLQVAANAESFDAIIALLDRHYSNNPTPPAPIKDNDDTMTVVSERRSSLGAGEVNDLDDIAEEEEEGEQETVGGEENGNEGNDKENENSTVGDEEAPSAKDDESVAIDIEGNDKSELVKDGDDETKIASSNESKHDDDKATSPDAMDDRASEFTAESASETPVLPPAETQAPPSAAAVEEHDETIAEFLDWVVIENKAKVLKLLLRYRTKLHDVTDEDIKIYMKHAAKNGHTETVGALIRMKPDVVDAVDDEGKTPLHHAANHGHDSTVQELLKANAPVNATTVDVDRHQKTMTTTMTGEMVFEDQAASEARANKQADERTPLHFAAANGWVKPIQSLLKSKADIDFPDRNGVTPLHLACQNGHYDAVEHLAKQNADVLKRDDEGLNCLDYAVDNGHETVAHLLLSHRDWKQLMWSCSWDEYHKERTTPMKKLIKNMPTAAERVMDKCMEMSDEHRKDNDFWMEFYFELLEDSFSLWENPGNSRARRSESEAKSENTNNNNDSKNEDEQPLTDNHNDSNNTDAQQQDQGGETEMTELIQDENHVTENHATNEAANEPPLAEKETTFIADTDAEGGKENQEFNNDETDVEAQRPAEIVETKDVVQQEPKPVVSAYDDEGTLRKRMRPYSSSSARMVKTHPLNIMVQSERVDLLTHPLVVSLLNHKWRHLGRYFFWTSLVLYSFFVAMLTGYVTVSPPSFYAQDSTTQGANGSVTWFVNGEERWIGGFQQATQNFFGSIGHWIILVLSVLFLLRELILLLIQRQAYFRFSNLLEWALYILAILLVIPLGQVEYVDGFGLRLPWQWQCGAVAVFLAWINLVMFLRRFSFLGIYVIMFTDILWSFVKFVTVLALFIVAFALAFYMLLMNQQAFHRVEYSLIKTFAMMVGELDFINIFHEQNYLETQNTLAAGEEDYFLSSVFFRGVTYAMFAAFLVVMTILVTNLLIGLAVYDIQEIRRKAQFHRLALQVEMVLEVQHYLPVCIWRSLMRSKKRCYPNNGCCSGMKKRYRALKGDRKVLKQAIVICERRSIEGKRYQEQVPNYELLTGMKTRLQSIDNKVESVNSRTAEDGTKKDGELRGLRDRFDRMERKIDALLGRKKLKGEEESGREASK